MHFVDQLGVTFDNTEICFDLAEDTTLGSASIDIMFLFAGTALPMEKSASSTIVVAGSIPVTYEPGQTVTVEANGLLQAILDGDYSIEICGKECTADESLSDATQVTCEVPLMITEFSKDLHAYPTSQLSSIDVTAAHTLEAVDTNPNYMWMKESWQNFA